MIRWFAFALLLTVVLGASMAQPGSAPDPKPAPATAPATPQPATDKLSDTDVRAIFDVMSKNQQQQSKQIEALQKEVRELKARVLKLEEQIAKGTTAEPVDKKAPAEKTPGSKPGKSNGKPEEIFNVTANDIDLTGERWDGKLVRFSEWKFGLATNEIVPHLEGLTIRSDGVTSVIQKKDLQGWIGFAATDSKGFLFMRLFAEKSKHADKVLGFKLNDKVSLVGRVFKMREAGVYGIVVETLE